MKKAVIFDMDGVVVNTEPIGYRANHQMYKDLNITVPDEVYATFIGGSDKNNMQKLKDLYNLEYTRQQLIDKKYEYYFKVFDAADDLTLMPGVQELIKDLHSHGMKLILASSAAKRKITKIFDRFGLHPFFDAVISGEDFEFSKPHPAIFLEAVKKTGCTANECVVIEDSVNGIAAAKAANIYCIAYKSGLGLPQDTTAADILVTDFKELNYQKIAMIH
ncbi:HAD family hydrolase [Flavobacterium rhizosphaerae]|uniref:HAD family phosphatase n=1 Tax=Flavobacterium rhizosphaerae TaxID=3163298 RepID=A0ABW8YY85_9FLAO